MTEQLESRITELEARVEAMQEYLRALMAFVPHEPFAHDVIAGATRNLHRRAATLAPEQKQALEQAVGWVGAQANTSTYSRTQPK